MDLQEVPKPMTPADTKLCRAIAKAEGKEVVRNDYAGNVWWAIIDSNKPKLSHYKECRHLDSYLTDPAETVRMLVALVDHYEEVRFHMYEGEIYCSCFTYPYLDLEDALPDCAGGQSVPAAIPQAYKAMLEEKANA